MSVASLGNCSNATRTSSEVFCTGMYTHAIAQFFLLTCVLSPSLPAPYTYDSRCCSPSPLFWSRIPHRPPGQSPQQPCLSSNATLIHSTKQKSNPERQQQLRLRNASHPGGWKISCHLVPTFILVFFSSSLPLFWATQEGKKKKKKKKKNQFNRLCAPGPS